MLKTLQKRRFLLNVEKVDIQTQDTSGSFGICKKLIENMITSVVA